MKIRQLHGIINVDVNSEIKKYQQQLVKLSFSDHKDWSEYHATLDKINLLRSNLLTK